MVVNGAQIPEALLQQITDFADKAKAKKEETVEEAKPKKRMTSLRHDLADANKAIRASTRAALEQAMQGESQR
jgi:hypothetical protein